MDSEEWRTVAGCPAYEVSTFGRVRRGGHIKALRADRKGYLSVILHDHQTTRTASVARLVAEAFIGPRPDGMVVRHLNGINTENRPANLAYGTRAENEADKIGHGTQLRGERHHQAKLTEQQVQDIRSRFKRFDRNNGGNALAREFGVSGTLITYIVSGKLWSYLPRDCPA